MKTKKSSKLTKRDQKKINKGLAGVAYKKDSVELIKKRKVPIRTRIPTKKLSEKQRLKKALAFAQNNDLSYDQKVKEEKKKIERRVQKQISLQARKPEVIKEVMRIEMIQVLKDSLIQKLNFELNEIIRQQKYHSPSDARYNYLSGESSAMNRALAIVTVEILEHWGNYSGDTMVGQLSR